MRLLLILLFILPFITCASNENGYAAWSKKRHEADRWTAVTEDTVRQTELPKIEPVDVSQFCPAYSFLGEEDRVRFWVGLLSKIALYESDFNPTDHSPEKIKTANGKNVESIGLLQLSPESASQTQYQCGTMTVKSLENPEKNLICGAKELAFQVKKYGRITSSTERQVAAGKVYRTLWPNKDGGHLDQISRYTRSLFFCSRTSS